ncbi:MAG TPA: FHA domain-containing protein [Anaerolineales bacterium]|nr:FHA domain-containing protein [Anaerolineales bacterium]
MPIALVTVEMEFGEKAEMALALDVPSRLLALKIMRDKGKFVRTGETFVLSFKTGGRDKPIPPDATLGELGIRDGQHLRLTRQGPGMRAQVSRAHAYLRTQSGEMLPLESNSVILGRKDLKQEGPLDIDLASYDPGWVISRRHASIGRDGANYYLLDLESTNGTKVNGEVCVPGRKMPLKNGDQIVCGLAVVLNFVVAASPTPKPGEPPGR